MKLAIVVFLNTIGTPGGATTGPMYMKNIFREYFDQDVDIISVDHKLVTPWVECKQYLFGNNDLVHDLNKYDFIIFNTPGYWNNKDPEGVREYDFCLDGLETPFALMINEERDYDIFTNMWEWTSHPMYRILLLNSEGMSENFQDIITDGVTPIEFQYFVPLDDLDTIIERSRSSEKINSIISTSRWTDRKRQKELISISDKLGDKGIETYIIGDSSSYFYTQKMMGAKELIKGDHLHIGEGYVFSQLPELLKPHRFHYNFVYTMKKNRKRVMRPRLELATFECYNEGLLPVICANTTPDWSNEGTIRLSADQLDELPDHLEYFASNRDALEYRLKKFYEMTMDICVDKIAKLYGKMMETVYGE